MKKILTKATTLYFGLLFCGAAQAASISLTNNDALNTSSFNAKGNWNSVSAPSAGNTYHTAGFLLRTPANSSSYFFGGDSLTLVSAGGATTLSYKGIGNTGVITIPSLILNSGSITHLNGSNDLFQLAGNIEVLSSSMIEARQGPITISANLSGSATLTNRSSGVGFDIILSGNNSAFTGRMVANNLTRLRLNDEIRLGGNPASFAPNHLTLDNCVFFVTNTFVIDDSNRGITVSSNVTFDVASGRTLSISNSITGSGVLTKRNPGTLALGGLNTYAGATIVNGGVLRIGAETQLGNNPGTFAAGHLTLNGGVLAGIATFTIDDINRGITLGTGNGTFDVATNTTLTVASGISGNGSLTNRNTGTLRLTGNNTYTGTTTVSAGTLQVDGTINSSGEVNVASGATLSGNGTVFGTTLVYGQVSPGASIGTLTFGQFLVVNATTASINLEINRTNAQNADRVVVGGELQVGGTLRVTNIGPPLVVGDTFDLFDATSVGSSPPNLILPQLAPGLEWDLVQLNSGVISVINSPNYVRIHSFGFPESSGMSPSEIIQGTDGKLYGRTQTGGSNNVGTIFRMNADGGGYQQLFSFSGTNGFGFFIEGSDGALYGTSRYGGTNNLGTLFKLNKDGTGYSLLHHFTNFPGKFIEFSNGMLYGTAGDSVVKINKDGTGYSVVRSFVPNGLDGSSPGTLVEGTDGAIYGSTGFGGLNGRGTIFKMNSNGTGFTVLLDQGNSTQIRFIRALFEASDGMLYGTSVAGGDNFNGTVFRIQKDGGGYAILRHFTSLGGEAHEPTALIEGSDGVLYGSTLQGGNFVSGLGYGGTLFKLNKNGGGYTVIRAFQGPLGDGATPGGIVEGDDGFLYVTTLNGGSSGDNSNATGEGQFGSGTAYKINKNGTGYSVLRNFSYAGGDGRFPESAMIIGTDGLFYGTTTSGGSNGIAGAIFRMETNGANYSLLHVFHSSGLAGNSPSRLEEGSDGFFYGTTEFGGSNNLGTVFKVNQSGGGFSLLREFSGGSDGWYPRGGVIEGSDGMIYGTTAAGGSGSGGTLFKLNKDGSGFLILKSFDGFEGITGPSGRLLEATDGALYGATASLVFKVNKDGSGFTVLKTVSGSMRSGLLEGSDGGLYGTTFFGGSNNLGTVFRLNKDGGDFALLTHFSNTGGRNPRTALVEGADGSLYGTTSLGSLGTGNGTIFRLNKNGSGFSTIKQFPSNGGSRFAEKTPGGLTIGSDGALYGAIRNGADMGLGAVFKLVPDLSNNSSPVVNNPLSDQTNVYGGAFNFTFSTNTFIDPDVGQTLTYTATNLPPGIEFSAATRTFAGTNTQAGNFSVIVTATDDGSPALSTNDVFDYVVSGAPLMVTADNSSRLVGEPNSILSGAITGVVNGDNIGVSFSTTATASSPPGNYPITPIFTDPDSRLGNYVVTTNLGALTINGVTIQTSLSGGAPTFCWPTNAANLILESAENLNAPITWNPVTNNISTSDTNFCFTIIPESEAGERFFRLRLP